jgi:hypothetical protein
MHTKIRIWKYILHLSQEFLAFHEQTKVYISILDLIEVLELNYLV